MIEPTAEETAQVIADSQAFLDAWRQNPRTQKTITGVQAAKGQARKQLTVRMLAVLLAAAAAQEALAAEQLGADAAAGRHDGDHDER